MKGTTPNTYQGSFEEKIAAIGSLYSPSRGIDMLVRNLLANPKIEHLIFAGPDLSGAMDDAMEMFLKPERITTNEEDGYYSHENAPELRIHTDIPIDVLSTLLWFIKARRAEKVEKVVHLLIEKQTSSISYDRNHSSESRKDLGSILYPPPRINPPTLPAPNNVHPIRVKTVGEGYLELLYQIMTFGKQLDTHYDEPTRELMNLAMVITDQDPDPETIPEFIPFDMVHLEEYIPRLCTNVEDPDVSYTYGNLIRGYFGVDQVHKVAKKLANDESSRSAVISLVDQKWNKKHSPCLNHIWFRLAGDALHMTAIIRSNDMFFGWPENAYGLRKLQDLVRVLIMNYKGDFQDDRRYSMGDLTIISQSAHIYERDWEPALEIVKKYRRPKEQWDEKGRWIFEPIEGDQFPPKIKAQLAAPNGPIVREIIGTPTEIRKVITDGRMISNIGHALWIGQMLGLLDRIPNSPNTS
jgi:thymidylate synthase